MKKVSVRNLFAEKQSFQGEVLDLIRISRTEMGAYLCIATNGVPPSVSKRIILTVECKLLSGVLAKNWPKAWSATANGRQRLESAQVGELLCLWNAKTLLVVKTSGPWPVQTDKVWSGSTTVNMRLRIVYDKMNLFMKCQKIRDSSWRTITIFVRLLGR